MNKEQKTMLSECFVKYIKEETNMTHIRWIAHGNHIQEEYLLREYMKNNLSEKDLKVWKKQSHQMGYHFHIQKLDEFLKKWESEFADNFKKFLFENKNFYT